MITLIIKIARLCVYGISFSKVVSDVTAGTYLLLLLTTTSSSTSSSSDCCVLLRKINDLDCLLKTL